MKLKGDDLQRKINSLGHWHHYFELAPGIATREPMIDIEERSAIVEEILKNRVKSKSVIDIGANAGKNSFIAIEQGANRVLAIDKAKCYIEQGKFIAEQLNISKVEFLCTDFEKTELTEKFDIALFLAVLYHVENPILCLRKIYNLLHNDGIMLIESLVDNSKHITGLNVLTFRDRQYCLFVPTRNTIEALLNYTGFIIKKEKTFGDNRVIFEAVKEEQ